METQCKDSEIIRWHVCLTHTLIATTRQVSFVALAGRLPNSCFEKKKKHVTKLHKLSIQEQSGGGGGGLPCFLNGM